LTLLLTVRFIGGGGGGETVTSLEEEGGVGARASRGVQLVGTPQKTEVT
jgi:hypothetical protein